MKLKTAKALYEALDIVYIATLFVLDHYLPDAFHWMYWVAGLFFTLYVEAFLYLLNRYPKMSGQKMVLWSMVMRGVKFLGTVVLMLIFVWAFELPEEPFLMYVLGCYLLSSLLESICAKAYSKEYPTQPEQ